jgi:hypothetical protein
VIALIAPADLAVRVPDTRAATFPDDIRDEQPETICGPRLASGRRTFAYSPQEDPQNPPPPTNQYKEPCSGTAAIRRRSPLIDCRTA